MKKISILLYHREKERFLRELQEQGVVHIVENSAREVSSLGETTNLLRRAETVVRELKNAAAGVPGAPAPADPADRDGLSVITAYEEIESRRLKIESAMQSCGKDVVSLEPWGDFNPATIDALGEAGVSVRFFRATLKAFDAVDQKSLIIKEIRREEGHVLFVAIGEGEFSVAGAEEVRLPRKSLSALQTEITLYGQQLKDIQAELSALVQQLLIVDTFRKAQREQLDLLSAQLDLVQYADGKLLALSGWIPESRETAISKFLDGFTAWYSITRPAMDENVPIQLKNNAFTRLFEPITRLYSLPAYNELDPTPFFAPAFAFFSGLCLGDVAYGAILFGLALLLYKKGPESVRPMGAMAMVLGGMTIFSGFLLNGFFGMAIFGGPGIEGAIFETGADMFAPLAATKDSYPAMSFALIVGFLQMLFAMVLQIANRVRRGEGKTAILPISWMLMFIGGIIWAAHTDPYDLKVSELQLASLQLGQLLKSIPLPVGMYTCLGGVGLMFLFGMMSSSANIFLRPLVFVWDFYNFATGNIGYMISYIRLFALGLTGGLLAMTFNDLALGFITTGVGADAVTNWASPMVIFTILLLIVGHALNFTLALVGAFVHPLRLTFVEFYQTLQFTGGGSEYRPLRRNE